MLTHFYSNRPYEKYKYIGKIEIGSLEELMKEIKKSSSDPSICGGSICFGDSEKEVPEAKVIVY